MEYKGYKIQVNQSDVAVIDGKGEWLIRVETEEEAKKWIDENAGE